MLLIGFSEIGKDVDSLAFGGPFNCLLMLPDTTLIKLCLNKLWFNGKLIERKN